MAPGPLDGIRVVELANFVAAPSGSALMADMGATVIKIEPPTGDGWRGRPALQSATQPANAPFLSPIFNHDNRGKRSIVLDVSTAAGQEAALRLIDRADVFLTNLLPHRRRRLGFDPAGLLVRNPRLVFVGVSGYGPDGPDADRPGFDYSAFWASSGIMSKLVEESEPPPLSRPALGDHSTGLANLTATLAALRLRDRTGEGQVAELSLFSVGHWVNSQDLVTAAYTGSEPVIHDRERPWNPLWNTYRCADGGWLMVTILQPDLYWERFCVALDHPEWIARDEWSSTPLRAQNGAALTEAIAAEFVTASLAEWTRRLDEQGIIFAPVSSVLDAVRREQTAAQQTVQPLDTPSGPMPIVRSPFLIDGAAIQPRGPAPQLGEHTASILAEAGYSEDEIAQLRAGGAFG